MIKLMQPLFSRPYGNRGPTLIISHTLGYMCLFRYTHAHRFCRRRQTLDDADTTRPDPPTLERILQFFRFIVRPPPCPRGSCVRLYQLSDLLFNGLVVQALQRELLLFSIVWISQYQRSVCGVGARLDVPNRA
jgi:hypothetical protein